MSGSRKDRVIILRTLKYGESDLVLHGLASSGQRLNLIAKGALRSRKRFGGGILQATHFVQVTYHLSKNASEDQALHVLLEASLLDDFASLRLNYDRLQLAFHFLTLVAQITRTGQEESRSLFDLLGNGLKALESSTSPQRLKVHFELKLLLQQGILPPDWPVRDWMEMAISQHADISTTDHLIHDLTHRIDHVLRSYLQN